MTRVFHAAAGAIILTAVWLGFNRPPAKAIAYDARAHLIAVMQQAGLTYTGRRELVQDETILSFSQVGCRAGTAVIYVPWVTRLSPVARGIIDAASRPPVYINDGEVVTGVGMAEIMPRWSWRRLFAYLKLRRDEPWTSIILAVLSPRDCPLPPIDWARLPQG
jgi:hypothetical protein